MNNLPTYELIIDGTDLTGVDWMAITPNPANERFIVAMSEDKPKQRIILQEGGDKHIITGVFLIPNQMIFRTGEEGDYQVFFSRQTIENIAKKFSTGFNNTNVNLDHAHSVDGVSLFETWLVGESQDKIYDLGFTKEDVPAGAWVGSYWVQNEILWDQIKAGEFGFSIEGFFDLDLKMHRQEETVEDTPADPVKEVAEIIKNEDLSEAGKVKQIKKFLIENL